MPGQTVASFETRIVESLSAAVPVLPPRCKVHLSLPASTVMFERMNFPATDSEELRGMTRLQLEKTLPYPAEEVTSDFLLVESGGGESVVMAVALSNAQLDLLCAPLREAGRLPEIITIQAIHLASLCPANETVLLIYMEDGRFVVAICSRGKLCFIHTLSTPDPARIPGELPHILLGAELEGVTVVFSRVQLDTECATIRDAVCASLGVPVDLFSIPSSSEDTTVNLFPSVWQGVLSAAENKARLKSRLFLAAGVYAVIVICASGYLFWLNNRLSQIDKSLHTIQPAVAIIQADSVRWNSLASALDPTHYTIELLHQVQKSMPSDSIRITEYDQAFDQVNGQFMIKGEAPTPALAIEFGEQLKGNPDLKDFHFEVPAPAILPNSEHAQFQIFGKL